MKTKEKDLTTAEIVKETDLKHIAVIMDGNRRWAKEKNLPSAMGHKKGVDALKTTLRACKDFGIKYLTVYAFSTENWKRKKEENKKIVNLFSLKYNFIKSIKKVFYHKMFRQNIIDEIFCRILFLFGRL